MAGPFLATVEVAGPFKFASKPYTMEAGAGPVVATAEEKPASEAIEPCACAVPAPETTLAEGGALAAKEEQIGKGGSWWAILAIGTLAVLAAGLAIYKKKATS